MAWRSRRSYSRLRGAKMFGQPRDLSASTTNEPRKPAPPVTITRCWFQKSMPSPPSTSIRFHPRNFPGQLVLQRSEVGIHHQLHQILEFNLRFPSQNLLCLRRIADQQVDFGGAIIALINLDILVPVETRVVESDLAEFPNRMRFTGRDHEVV